MLDRMIRQRRIPTSVRADNGTKFTSKAMPQRACWHRVTQDFNRPGHVTDNGLIAAFNGRLRAAGLNAHCFLSLADAEEKVDAWRKDCKNPYKQGPPLRLTG